MQARHIYSLMMGFACLASIGCCGCLRNGCGTGGQVYSDCCGSCDATCGCPDAACGCPEASCCCPDAACGCPEASCCCPDNCSVGCGSPVVGQCRLLQRIKNAVCGCSGCGSERYYGDWHSSPPCDCESENSYGGQGASIQGGPVGRRPSVAGRHRRLNEAFEFADQDEPTYR